MSTPGRRLAALALLVLAGGAAGTLLAQAPPETEALDPPATQDEAARETPAPADVPPPAEARGEDKPASSEDFIPSERIPADASIAFPVDI